MGLSAYFIYVSEFSLLWLISAFVFFIMLPEKKVA